MEEEPMDIDDTVPSGKIIESSFEKSDTVNDATKETNKDQQNTEGKTPIAVRDVVVIDNEDSDDTDKPPEKVTDKTKDSTAPMVISDNEEEAPKEKSKTATTSVDVSDNTDKPPEKVTDKTKDSTAPMVISDNEEETPKEKSKTATTPVDVVVLDDDEEEPKKAVPNNKPCDIIDLVAKKTVTGNTKCINYSCESGKDMIEAPLLCLSYFRVKNTENKRREVCRECYNQAIKFYDELAEKAIAKENLYGMAVPLRNDLVEIDDSDSDDDQDKEKNYFDEETVKFLDENINGYLEDALHKFEFEKQVEDGLKFMLNKVEKQKDDYDEVDDLVKSLRYRLDKVQFELYDQFRTKQRQLRPIEIITDHTNKNSPPKTYVRTMPVERRSTRNAGRTVDYIELDDNTTPNSTSTTKVQATPIEAAAPADLPPKGEIVKPLPAIGELYYAARFKSRGSWMRVRLSKILQPGDVYNSEVVKEKTYVATAENKEKKELLVNPKEMAYVKPCNVRLEVGARVIAAFKDVSNLVEGGKAKRDVFYPGIVAESLSASNLYRYLIFFDDGYAQYVNHNMVFLTFESSKDVWDDIYVENRAFIKKYLESYPARSMVKLNKNQTVRTEHNGKWWLSTVMNIDCSLVQVHFETSNRIEWIYRGSSRLSPMYKEELAATNRIQNKPRTTRMLANNAIQNDVPFVQYSRSDSDNQKADADAPKESEPPVPPRAVAKKSTAKPTVPPIIRSTEKALPFLPLNPNAAKITPPSKIVYYTPREQTQIAYKSHKCSPKCKEFVTYNLNKLNGYNPLAKPLLCGWNRVLYKYKNRREVNYKAPCGRLVRNMSELHKYLMMSKSDMTVDLFDFEPWMRCLAEFVLDSSMVINKDLTAGVEQVPIPVVNYIDNDQLDFCNYSNRRQPMEGVNLNLDTEFLCGCDCEDDCRDKSKCACWQLTLEGVRFMQGDINPDFVGYSYRRLLEPVATGIYECNSRCKCASTCLNRVVQNPLQLKLQVFKTNQKGWGIRCLNDIPQGSFICIYAGSLLTEQMANEGGKNYGDEYLAELDYIEIVETTKQDYEEEAYNSDNEKEKKSQTSQSADEEEEEEEEERFVERPGRKRYGDDGDFVPNIPLSKSNNADSIRTRLRRRNAADEKEQEKQEPEKAKETPADETVTISDDENDERELTSFNPKTEPDLDEARVPKYLSVRQMYGEDESVYIMDAKNTGNIGRFLNHSCSPNVFVQNVFVDTHDVRFPWVAFFALQYIRAGTELTWNYNYDIGSVPGKVLYCYCSAADCKGRLL